MFEASSTPGGVVRSSVTAAGVLEWGPQRTRLVPAIRRLVDELGLRDRLVRAEPGLPLLVFRSGSLHEVPRSVGELWKGGLLTLRGRARVLAEPMTRRPSGDETVADALRRAFGSDAYRAFLGPLFGGLYASDPADMRARDTLLPLLARLGDPRSLLLAALRLRRAAPSPVSFQGGLAELTDAMARSLAPRVYYRAPAETLVRTPSGWEIAGPDGPRGTYDDVILTIPAAEAARLLGAAAPAVAAALRALRYNRVAVVHLQAKGPAMRALGYQVAFGERLHTRGVTFNDATFNRPGIVTAFLGGTLDARATEWSNERIAAVAEREFAEVTGRRARTLDVSRPSIPSYDRTWAAMDGMELPPGIHLCAAYLGRPGLTGRLDAAGRLAEALGVGTP